MADTLDSVGDRLRSLRGKKTLREFANTLGVHVNTLLAYEKGRGRPKHEFLLRVCETTNCDKNWLLLGADSPIVALPKQQLDSTFSNKVFDPNADIPLTIKVCDALREYLGDRVHSMPDAQFFEIVTKAVWGIRAFGALGPELPRQSVINAAIVMANLSAPN